MKKINTLELCEKFNKIRQENIHKIFSPQEMMNLLKNIGISSTYFREMVKNNFFRMRKNHQNREYTFTDTPIYKAQFEKIYNDFREKQRKPKTSNKFTEKEAIDFLKSLGYQIFKSEGIDEDKLQKLYPNIYKELEIIKQI